MAQNRGKGCRFRTPESGPPGTPPGPPPRPGRALSPRERGPGPPARGPRGGPPGGAPGGAPRGPGPGPGDFRGKSGGPGPGPGPGARKSGISGDFGEIRGFRGNPGIRGRIRGNREGPPRIFLEVYLVLFIITSFSLSNLLHLFHAFFDSMRYSTVCHLNPMKEEKEGQLLKGSWGGKNGENRSDSLVSMIFLYYTLF